MHGFTYDLVNQLASYDPPQVAAAGETRYEYDLDGGLTRVIRPGGDTIDLAYDGGGRLSALRAAGVSRSLTYDARGDLAGISDAEGSSLHYAWDGFKRCDVAAVRKRCGGNISRADAEAAAAGMEVWMLIWSQ